MLSFEILIPFLHFLAVNSEESCHYPNCKYNAQGIGFPGNVQDLDKMCSADMEYRTCYNEFFNRCYEDNTVRNEKYQAELEVLHKVCDNESEIYIGLVPHLGCYKESLLNSNVSCRNIAREIQMPDGIIENGSGPPMKDHCLRASVHYSCMAMKVGESCGEDAEKAFMNAINELKKTESSCKKSIYEEISELALQLNIEEKQKTLILKLLDQ